MSKQSKNKRISLLLLGPGHGNNIFAFLDLLFSADCFDVSLLTKEYLLQDTKFDDLNILDFGQKNTWKQRLRLGLLALKAPKHEILIILGGSNLFEVMPVFLFARRKRTVFSIWGETIPNMLSKKGSGPRLYRLILNKCDLILCNWYGTRDTLVRNAPNLAFKIQIQGWGISQQFIDYHPMQHDFTISFINSLPKDKVIFINMRSLDYYNEIDLILEATIIIRERCPDDFNNMLLIFWHGNNIRSDLLHQIQNHIKTKQMDDTIWCVRHPFVPESDIRHIVDACHVVMNYVNRDQLSSSVVEAMYLKKMLILSDIKPYRILNEKVEAELKLTELSAEALAHEIVFCMRKHIEKDYDEELLNNRANIVQYNYTRSACIPQLRRKLEDLLRYDNS